MFPTTGGQYVYLREAYGRGVAFLCAWSSLLVIYAGAVAWLAMSFAMYLAYFVPLTATRLRGMAIAVIVVITALNYAGLKLGKWTQNLLTFLKLGGVATVILVPLLAKPVAQTAAGRPTAAAFGVAMIACLLIYDGWVALGYVAGEIREPQRTIPRAIGIGIAVVILCYVAANFAYLRVLTVAEMAASARVASQAMERAVGTTGAGLVALAVCFSVLGAVNGFTLAPPRMYFAMARDGLFFRTLGDVHDRFGTPHRAILMQGIWAAVIALTGTYEALGSFAMLAAFVFYGLSVAGVIVLRKKRPLAVRPYRMWGYPWTATIFVVVAAGFVANTVIETPRPAAACLVLMTAGIPVYWFWRRKNG